MLELNLKVNDKKAILGAPKKPNNELNPVKIMYWYKDVSNLFNFSEKDFSLN